MATVKTAISLQESLFSQVEELAREMQLSRSQLVALALEAFVERQHNQHLLREINQAYDVEPMGPRSPARKNHHRRSVEGEW
ncbi:MAG: CopG family transcriptional regulator [Herpetosiphonaceae bacterium]|nr:CopG family transcriptional regulator [Herpetosiphonaceae bacterium]